VTMARRTCSGSCGQTLTSRARSRCNSGLSEQPVCNRSGAPD
jgi:hypothetical protein